MMGSGVISTGQAYPLLGANMTPPKTEYRTIPLTRGRVAVVDAADYDQLSQHKWFCSPDKGSGVRYAVRKKGPYQVFMHRELLGLERFNPLRSDRIAAHHERESR